MSQKQKTKTQKKVAVQPKQNQQVTRIPRQPREKDEDLKAYLCALVNPFDDCAIGAQVPDRYAYPTNAVRAKGTFVCSSDANGVASMIMFADPFLSLLDMGGSAVSSANCGMAQYTNSVTSYAAATVASMQGLLNNFRLVGGGIKIRNNLPPTTATGRCIVAKIPAPGQMPGVNSLTNSVLLNSYIAGAVANIGSTTANTHLPSDILEFPDSAEYTLQDLITNELSVNFKPISALSEDFALTSTAFSTYNATLSAVSGDTVTTATGVPTTNDILNQHCRGWDCILLRFEGLPASTANCVEVEYIYHFEGSPKVALSSGSGFAVSVSNAKRHVNIVKYLSVIEQVASNPAIHILAKNVAEGAMSYAKAGPAGLMAMIAAKIGLTI